MKDGICSECDLPFLKQFWIGRRHGLLKELINLYKYHSIRVCALVFADLIAELYGDYLKSHTIVPLPTIEKHIRERGFDHTKKLAKAVAKTCGAKCAYLLARGNDCVQVGANEETRRKQAKTAYKVRNKTPICDRVVLLDDV